MSLVLRNPHLSDNAEDFLYHFGFGNRTLDLKAVFGNTKFVCVGGSPSRFKHYAELFANDVGLPVEGDLSQSDRFVIYKTGPVLWINHGMGTPSLSIMMNEVLKLIHYSGAQGVHLVRLGTSGGVGVAPGTVVVSRGAMNGELEQNYVQWIAGKKVVREASLDADLRKDLLATAEEMKIPVETGLTLCADDFYEGQMRLDGFACEYTMEDKFAFLRSIHDLGVRNIEMESTCFASMTKRAGLKAAIVCVTLLNRMEGDQVKIEKDDYLDFETRPFRLVSALIRKVCGLNKI